MASYPTNEKSLFMNVYDKYCNGENNFSENEWLEIVKKDEFAIEFIKNPSEEIQLLVVKQDGYAIKYIINPSKDIQLLAVKQNKYAIRFIENPSEKVQLETIKSINYRLPLNITSKKAIKRWRLIKQMKKACL